MNPTPQRLRLAVLLLLALLLSACGPGRKLQKYDYLTEDAHTYNEEAEKADPTPSRDEPEPEPDPSDESSVDLIVRTALSYEGVPYKYGGTTRRGMDCSGLVNVSFQAANKSVPRTSSQIADQGQKVPLRKVQPGHLLLFSAKGGSRIDHVGLVVEVDGHDIAFIHATTSAGVRVDRLSDDYWERRFRKAVAF